MVRLGERLRRERERFETRRREQGNENRAEETDLLCCVHWSWRRGEETRRSEKERYAGDDDDDDDGDDECRWSCG